MIHIAPGGWTFIRQIGIGDVEHVRGQVLQVAIISRECQVEQLKGVYRAGRDLNMMCRAHVNATRVDEMRLISVLEQGNAQHQIELWKNLHEEQFKLMLSRCDIVIMRGDEPITGVEIYLNVLKLWHTAGGRFLKGNFGRIPANELRETHGDFNYPRLAKDAWGTWNV